MRVSLAFVLTAIGLGMAPAVQAAGLFDVGGQVSMQDGTSAEGVTGTMSADLNRNGTFEAFETVPFTVGAGGIVEVAFTPEGGDVSDLQFLIELAEKVAAKGFKALSEDGPLTLSITASKKGYTTVTQVFALNESFKTLDLTLAKLQAVGCNDQYCTTPNGSVMLDGMKTSGAVEAYAEPFSPTTNRAQFPGSFADSDKNLLVSSGFVHVDLFDKDGGRVTTPGSPVTYRFGIPKGSWSSLADLVAGTDRIDLPLYSFSESTSQWVAEANGFLTDQAGQPVSEANLAAIKAGTYDGRIFAQGQASHFSTFNVDRPVKAQTCVKGRVVDEEGNVLGGAVVTLSGINFDGGGAPLVTAADGLFASAAPKSETAGEDVDADGEKGKTFTARLEVGGDGYYGHSKDYEMSTEAHFITANHGINCAPATCECLDLGDVVIPKRTVDDVKTCKVPVTTVADEDVAEWSWSRIGPIPAGSPVPNAAVTFFAQNRSISTEMGYAACGQPPAGIFTNTNGQATVCLPYDEELKGVAYLASTFQAPDAEGVTPTYWSIGQIEAGCPESITISMAYSGMASLARFTSGDLPPRDGELEEGDDQEKKRKKSCWFGGNAGFALLAPLLLGLGGAGFRRRRKQVQGKK